MAATAKYGIKHN